MEMPHEAVVATIHGLLAEQRKAGKPGRSSGGGETLTFTVG